jgi:hypothetical protein
MFIGSVSCVPCTGSLCLRYLGNFTSPGFHFRGNGLLYIRCLGNVHERLPSKMDNSLLALLFRFLAVFTGRFSAMVCSSHVF